MPLAGLAVPIERLKRPNLVLQVRYTHMKVISILGRTLLIVGNIWAALRGDSNTARVSNGAGTVNDLFLLPNLTVPMRIVQVRLSVTNMGIVLRIQSERCETSSFIDFAVKPL